MGKSMSKGSRGQRGPKRQTCSQKTYFFRNHMESLYPCSTKTREVLGNPPPTPQRFPETKEISQRRSPREIPSNWPSYGGALMHNMYSVHCTPTGQLLRSHKILENSSETIASSVQSVHCAVCRGEMEERTDLSLSIGLQYCAGVLG